MNRKQRKSIAILIMGVFLLALVAGHSIQPVAMASDEITREVDTIQELLSAIYHASDGDVIGITGRIAVHYDDLVIGGNGKRVTIKRMNSESRITMNSSNYVVTFQNITFDGAEIVSSHPFVYSQGDVLFENVNFVNCYSSTEGGAVRVLMGSAYFDNCIFDNNRAVQGGHIYVSQYPPFTNVEIHNSTFINGHATSDGGAIRVDRSPTTCNIYSSIIKDNSADSYGGGISNYGRMIIEDTKLYDNTATYGGADIANATYGNLNLLGMTLEIMTDLFEEDGIVPLGWVNDYDFESGVEFFDIDPEADNSLFKLEYEVPPTEVILDPESLGVAGDEKITGLESGKYYKVTMDDVISYTKADGTLTTDEAEAEPLLGTEIIGLTNGMTYRVEEYTRPVEEEPEEPGDDEEPLDPIDDEEPNDEEPGEEDETPGDEEQENNDQEEQEQEETDQDETEETETPSESNADQVSSQEQSSTSSSSSRSTTDIAEINPSSSSTVNNYFYGDDRSSSNHQTPSDAPYSLPVAQSGATNPQTPVTQEQTIKIDAASLIPDGVKVQEDGNGLTINVNVNVGSEGNGGTVQAQVQPDNGIPLVDVVKICLLFGIFICVFKRPGSN
ncbi:hypothetical protein HYG86_11415 [Alkalicella caledoniensis]|uniref:Right handed beta helix domain-containing protein n=1 Tax=Alkalicella caledoniensis TaxID=2731377 RepID=A0A7G9W9G9_ALKCA|nr:hypothetical protein [Alkalicella caledoniensis]QNO15331.1 hypothetical protein HYG86_11415 [Alkalicella caledoniensis]